MKFLFTKNRNYLINLIKDAEKFIKIVAFQFTSKEFINLLIEKARLGLEIELITLPEDSYSKQEERKKITEFYKSLRENNIRLYLCDWEVGDPSLTSTSMSGELKEGGGDKWYSLHGKLIITDKNAVIMSFNFIEQNLLESFLIFNNEKEIREFDSKFKKVKKMFINRSKFDKIYGSLIENLDKNTQKSLVDNYNKTKRKLVKDYPPEITPEKEISTGLFISPFEGRLRNLLYEFIELSEEFIYIVSERLFDDDFVKFIGKNIINNENINLKILTSPPQMVRQNIQKARQQFRQIKVFGGDIKAIENLHAKFWVNDKFLILTSANLTKMNLGFRKSNNFWRANTEFFYIENNQEIIANVKKTFERVYQNAKNIQEVLGKSTKAKSKAKEYFDLFEKYSKKEAKIVFGKFRLKFTIDAEKNLIKIAKYASILANKDKSRYIDKNHVIEGGILLFLQKRSSTLRELQISLDEICTTDEIKQNINALIRRNYIEKENENYRINIEKLLKSNEKKQVQQKLKI